MSKCESGNARLRFLIDSLISKEREAKPRFIVCCVAELSVATRIVVRASLAGLEEVGSGQDLVTLGGASLEEMTEGVGDGEGFGVDGLLDLHDVSSEEAVELLLRPCLTVCLDFEREAVEGDVTPTETACVGANDPDRFV